MDKVRFNFSETEETVDFFVLEQTKINGIQYILVTEQETGDAEAYILKDISDEDAEEAVYEMVDDDTELEAVSKVFEQELEDIDIEM